MSLHDQPSELLRLVMCEVGSPLDLYHLISASAPCLAVFSLSTELILYSVLQNSFPCELHRYATAILNVPTAVPASRALRKEKLIHFLTRSFKGIPFDFPTTRLEMVPLCRLHTRLVRLSDGFLDNTMHKFGVLGQGVAHPTQSSVETAKVVQSELEPAPRRAVQASKYERLRIHKALLRFELYCKVFPMAEGYKDSSAYDAHEQFNLFLSQLTPWEVEGMACIHQYFSSLLADAVDEIEEQIVNAVLAAPGVRLPPADGSMSEDTYADTDEDRLCHFGHSELAIPYMHGEIGRFDYVTRMSHMSSGGFDFMHQLVGTDKAGRAELIRGCQIRFGDFFSEALSCSPYSGPQTIQPEGSREDDQSYGNLGYYIFKPSTQDIYLKINLFNRREHFLREFGYVFWDAERIRTPAVFDKLRQAGVLEVVESCRLYDQKDYQNFKNQLRGVMLPQNEMRRIENEFGSI